jgi:hypothetical protein
MLILFCLFLSGHHEWTTGQPRSVLNVLGYVYRNHGKEVARQDLRYKG